MVPSRTSRAAGLLGLLLSFLVADARAVDEVPTKALDPKAEAKVFLWKSAGGVVCHWRAPKRYDPEKGTNLTFLLHGTGLTHGWGFANHPADRFRPDDLVVSPDGTSPGPNGSFLFLKEDGKKFHALIEEIKKVVVVRAVFLYGHSQGSFFALHYAGEFPEDVTGVVAHASGLWNFSQIGKRGHHQAIVLMHGTQDPVVPFGNSIFAYGKLKEAGYPIFRLRALEWWNHWPAEVNGAVPHTSQQLAWVEGMTTTDPERLTACFDVLAKVENDGVGEHDFVGAWSLAGRIVGMPEAPADLKSRAGRTRQMVEDLAKAHVEAMGLPEKIVFEKKPWIAHLPTFLRAFQGVPACDELAVRLKDAFAENTKEGVANLRKYYAHREKKPAEAFDDGLAAVQTGFLHYECWNDDWRKEMKALRKDAKKHKIGKAALKTYDDVFEAFDEVLTDGTRAFETVNRKHGTS